jgi:hypothetical protein
VEKAGGGRGAYRLLKKYKRYSHIGRDGRKNCLVAGMDKTSRVAVVARVLITGAEGVIASEKRYNAARNAYCISNRVQ